MWKRPELATNNSEETIFAVTDTTRAMGQNDRGPILSLHSGENAEDKAKKASKRLKGGQVSQLQNYRQFRKGDHVNYLTDCVPPRDPHRAERQDHHHQASLEFFQRLWGRKS
jgi:hypothetical protein